MNDNRVHIINLKVKKYNTTKGNPSKVRASNTIVKASSTIHKASKVE